ncbi:MAG: hypothetical protein AAF411_23875 [Myxococcota bacterium]
MEIRQLWSPPERAEPVAGTPMPRAFRHHPAWVASVRRRVNEQRRRRANRPGRRGRRPPVRLGRARLAAWPSAFRSLPHSDVLERFFVLLEDVESSIERQRIDRTERGLDLVIRDVQRDLDEFQRIPLEPNMSGFRNRRSHAYRLYTTGSYVVLAGSPSTRVYRLTSEGTLDEVRRYTTRRSDTFVAVHGDELLMAWLADPVGVQRRQNTVYASVPQLVMPDGSSIPLVDGSSIFGEPDDKWLATVVRCRFTEPDPRQACSSASMLVPDGAEGAGRPNVSLTPEALVVRPRGLNATYSLQLATGQALRSQASAPQGVRVAGPRQVAVVDADGTQQAYPVDGEVKHVGSLRDGVALVVLAHEGGVQVSTRIVGESLRPVTELRFDHAEFVGIGWPSTSGGPAGMSELRLRALDGALRTALLAHDGPTLSVAYLGEPVLLLSRQGDRLLVEQGGQRRVLAVSNR